MTVTLSLFAGAGAQFLDNSGNVLTGGLIYTYAAGTTTPLATYTSNLGTSAHPNPIVLDASGRVPGGEIWLTTGFGYKFLLKDSNNVLLGTYDNVPSSAQSPIANDASSISYEQGYTLTAGAFVIGNTYLITSIGTTNFVNIGATSNTVGVLFIATGVGSGTGTAKLSRTVQTKLQEFISVKDFGATGDGSTNDLAAVQAAVDYCAYNELSLHIPQGVYKLSGGVLRIQSGVNIYGENAGFGSRFDLYDSAYISIDGTRDRVLGTDGNIYETGGQLIGTTPPPSAGWSVTTFGTWTLGIPGQVGYTITGSDGNRYQCIKPHIYTADTYPITGANWATYWKLFNPLVFTAGRLYNGGGFVFRINIQDIMVWPQAGHTANQAILVNSSYNVTLRRIFVYQFRNSYGILIGLSNTNLVEYPVVYGTGSAQTGIFVWYGSPATKLMYPDVEACNEAINVNGDSGVDIFSPYIERTTYGITSNTNSFGYLNSYGGDVASNPYNFLINGPNTHIYSPTVYLSPAARSTKTIQQKGSFVKNAVLGDAQSASIVALDNTFEFIDSNVNFGTDSTSRYFDPYYRIFSAIHTNASGGALNIVGIDMPSSSTGQVIQGTITFYATIGSGECNRKSKYSFVLTKNGTSSTLNISSLQQIENVGVDTAAYTLSFSPVAVAPADRIVFRAVPTAGGSTGAANIVVYTTLELWSVTGDFTLTRYSS